MVESFRTMLIPEGVSWYCRFFFSMDLRDFGVHFKSVPMFF